jgi:hypothetical protein
LIVWRVWEKKWRKFKAFRGFFLIGFLENFQEWCCCDWVDKRRRFDENTLKYCIDLQLFR